MDEVAKTDGASERLSTSSPLINQFQLNVGIHIETSHLFCRAKQITAFYMKRNIKLKQVN